MSGPRMYCRYCDSPLFIGMSKCSRCGMRRENLLDRVINTEIELRLNKARDFLEGMWNEAWDNSSITGGFVDMFKLRKLRDILNGENEE